MGCGGQEIGASWQFAENPFDSRLCGSLLVQILLGNRLSRGWLVADDKVGL